MNIVQEIEREKKVRANKFKQLVRARSIRITIKMSMSTANVLISIMVLYIFSRSWASFFHLRANLKIRKILIALKT